VVDDDPRCRNAVARLLVEEGYEATEAADGEEASGLLASWKPDLVVTDLDMPRLDGRGLVQRVRRVRPGTPVLVLSARSDLDPGLTEGFFPKPVRIESLLARIRDLVGV
jgi:DNA-binding response OmpR family regulator